MSQHRTVQKKNKRAAAGTGISELNLTRRSGPGRHCEDAPSERARTTSVVCAARTSQAATEEQPSAFASGGEPSYAWQTSSHASFTRLQSLQTSQLDQRPLRQQSQAGPSQGEQDTYLLRLLHQGLHPPQNAQDMLVERPAKRQRSSALEAVPSGAPQPPPKPSQLLRGAMGDAQYAETRSVMLKHQELFLGQLYELHRVVQLQRHLVSVCDNCEAMDAELAKLEAEQQLRLPGSSDVTVEQESQQEAGQAAWQAAAQPAATQAGPVPGQLSDPGPVLQQAGWQGWFGRLHPLGFPQQGLLPGSLPGWGMPGLAGGAVSGTFASPFGGMAPPMDPMMAWYMVHYGQYAQAMQNAAAAGAHVDPRQAGEAAPCAQPREAPRWWHDPEKVFGVAGIPAALAPEALPKPSRRPDMQTEATSKPPANRRPKPEGGTDSKEGKEAPAGVTRTAAASPGEQAIAAVPSQQKAGSGRSAFKKLATKSPTARRPPSRAESIGSEVSRSAVERSPVDEGESSGVAHHGAAGGRPGSDHAASVGQ